MKANWIGQIWGGNCLLIQVIEGKTGGEDRSEGKRGRRRKQAQDDLEEKRDNEN